MNEDLKIILQALNAGNKGGLFTLQESHTIIQAYARIELELTKEKEPDKKKK